MPLRPEVARLLHEVYLSKGVHGTAAIEGNTLSEEEVLARVRGQLELPGSQSYLTQEIDNIVAACNSILAEMDSGDAMVLTPDRIKWFNRQVLENLDVGPDVVPGEVRKHSVGVLTYRGAPAEDCEYLLEEMCHWLGTLRAPDPELRFTYAMIRAIMAHLYIAWIHPFGDGNGRTARLIEFQLLIQAGVPVPVAHLLSDHYNRTREQYYRELAKTSKPPYSCDDFIHYALRGFVDELRLQLGVVREEQMAVTWENYVHERFRDNDTPSARRQKHVVLDLPDGQPVRRADIPKLSVRVATAYAGKGSKTVTRDLNTLSAMGLIARDANGVTARRSVIRAFLPSRADVVGE
ncbi:MAG TPA: Fic family protein [Mycobacteriales bacterium]|nr:Fic family protein [Mycobacteriales bacterium]